MKKVITLVLLGICQFSFGQVSDTIQLETFLDENIHAVAVESKGGVLNVNGYKIQGKDTTFVTRQVLLRLTEVLAVSKWSYTPHFSLITVPFKVRNSIDTFPQSVQTGLTNAGIGLNFINYKLTRYFSSGKSSTHSFGLGVIIAPSAEELTPANTNKFVNKTSKQLFISTGISITYTYNDLTFALIPVGFDFATTTDGKNYIYNKKRWLGLGIGISTKLFGLF